MFGFYAVPSHSVLWSCAFHPRGLQQIPVITSPHLLFIYSGRNYLWTLVPFAKSLLALLTLIKLIHPAKWKVVSMPIPGSALFPGGNTLLKQWHELILQLSEWNLAAVISVIEQLPLMPFKSCLAAAKEIWKKNPVCSHLNFKVSSPCHGDASPPLFAFRGVWREGKFSWAKCTPCSWRDVIKGRERERVWLSFVFIFRIGELHRFCGIGETEKAG